MKTQSQRQLRVGENLRHLLADAFLKEDFFDSENPSLQVNVITVSQVQISPDLKNATIFVMPLSGKNQDNVLKSLKKLTPYIRHKVGQKLTIRHTPALHFVLDETFDKSSHIDNLLRLPNVQKDISTQ